MARAPLRFFEEHRIRGAVVRVRIGRRPAYTVNDAARARYIQVIGNGRQCDKRGPFIETFTQVTGDGVATCRAEHQRILRPLARPAFHHTRMPGYATWMGQHAEEHIAGWTPGQVIDADEEIAQLAAASLTNTLFMGQGDRRPRRQRTRRSP